MHELFLTISSVELGEARGMAAGQLRGAPEGRWQQVRHQRAVTHFCQTKTKRKIQTLLKLHMN